MNALIARLQIESNELINFTRQLEIARAEKEAADISMEALLQQKSDALPYAVLGSQSSSANLALNRDIANNSISGGNFYSFDFFNPSLGANSFSCARSTNFTTIEGIIEAVYGNTITVGVPGSNGSTSLNLNVGACSNLQSASQNYKMKVGDRIQASGNGSGSSINLIQGSCY